MLHLLKPLQEPFGQSTGHTAPTSMERALDHLAYAAGAVVPAWVVLGVMGHATPVGLDTVLGFTALPAALLYLFLLWAVFYRDAPPEPWFASHLVWLSLSFGDLALAVAVGALFFAVGLLFAAIAPPIVFLIIYGPLVLGTLLIMWFAYRCLRGYLAYLGKAPVGQVS